VRGRLVFAFLAELAQLDTVATEGAGYNPKLHELRVSYDPAGNRTTTRRETLRTFRAQVETQTFDALRVTQLANAPVTQLVLIAHMRDLEIAGLVDEEGRALVRVNDRVVRIRAMDGVAQHFFPNPPGVFITEVGPAGFGYGGRRNLLVMRLADRAQAPTR
jgi:hypothetical protein